MNEASDIQSPIFALMSNPATHGGDVVTRIDTHAASVFLAGDRAYKIKRAASFPFLDYSTLEKRKAACEAELEVNRPFAPDLYRRVVPITRESDGRLALDGRGPPVEYAVELRRFDERRSLDRIAANEGINDALADDLGRLVAEAHRRARPVAFEPWIAALSDYNNDNSKAFAADPDLFPAEAAKALARASHDALVRLTPLLRSRGRAGLIRRSHGDLHLANIALIEDRPVLFDAIEFSPLIATGDVLYELAFLVMDLVERRCERAANIVFNRYLAETGRPEDLDGLALLPLFISLRAAIRAKVVAAQIERAGDEKHVAIKTSARAYFDLATRAINSEQPKLIAVGGLSGTGKTALARSLAMFAPPLPGAVVLRSDSARKTMFGVAELARLPAEAYAPAVTKRVYATLIEAAERALRAGHSAIVDAVFARPEERDAIADAAKRTSTVFNGLFLTTDLETRLARVGARIHDASDTNAAVASQQETYEIGELDWMMIDASGLPEATLKAARETIKRIP